MKEKLPNLENLSIEELKNLRSEITSLIEEKFAPKYKEDDCFINPKDLSFGYILGIGTEYEISVNFNSESLQHVSEQYLDNCIIISQEDYDELLISENDISNDVYKFRDEKYKEIRIFKESLEKKLKDKIQKMITEYQNES